MDTIKLKQNDCGLHYSKLGGNCSKCKYFETAKPYSRMNAGLLAMVNNGKVLEEII